MILPASGPDVSRYGTFVPVAGTSTEIVTSLGVGLEVASLIRTLSNTLPALAGVLLVDAAPL